MVKKYQINGLPVEEGIFQKQVSGTSVWVEEHTQSQVTETSKACGATVSCNLQGTGFGVVAKQTD
jgi:hypothetical protein